MAISRRDWLLAAGCSLAGGFLIGSSGASGLQARVFDAAIVGGGTAGLSSNQAVRAVARLCEPDNGEPAAQGLDIVALMCLRVSEFALDIPGHTV